MIVKCSYLLKSM